MLWLLLLLPAYSVSISLEDTARYLVNEALKEQWINGTGPPAAYHQRGIFPSYVRLNFYGDPKQVELRRSGFEVPDDNMFVTAFVSLLLGEINQIGGQKISIPQDRLTWAMDAILAHKDRNIAADVPRFGFWNQQKREGVWEQFPINLEETFVELNKTGGEIKKFLLKHGWDKLWKELAPIFQSFTNFEKFFEIPPDVDDTSMALAVHAWFSLNPSTVTEKAVEEWNSQQFSIPAIFQQYKMYRYCPGSTNNTENLIDPRTYYWLRHYLSNNSQDCFFTTWLQSVEETANHFKHTGPLVPLVVNNIDITVNANAIFATSLLLLLQKEKASWFDSELQRMYISIIKLLGWTAETGSFIPRSDLSLVYYPPITDFYWFLGRILHLLESELHNKQKLPFTVMHQANDILKHSLRGNVTTRLLQSGGHDTLGLWYWDGFLGANDTTADGKPDPHHDDRLFTTSSACNAFLDIWTISTPTGSYQWIEGTPQSVKDAVKGGIEWIRLNHKTELTFNCFYSGSVKGSAEMPWGFPSNVKEHVPSYKPVPCDYNVTGQDSNLLVGVRGIIPESEYQQKLKHPCLGGTVPWSGSFNSDGPFPFWSSGALSQTLAAAAVVKYASVSGEI